MRTLAKPINMVVVSNEQGVMTPIKFKTKSKANVDMVINVDKVISQEVEKLSGNVMILFKCRGLVGDKEREYELKYEVNSCKWMLWKM